MKGIYFKRNSRKNRNKKTHILFYFQFNIPQRKTQMYKRQKIMYIRSQPCERMLDALEPLTNVFGGREEFCRTLTECQAIIAGSFPLYFALRPWPLHRQTKSELHMFIFCMHKMGYVLPVDPVLKKIAELLQCNEFDSDFKNGALDVDIYINFKGAQTITEISKPMQPFAVDPNQDYESFYRSIDSNVASVWNYNVGNLKIQIIGVFSFSSSHLKPASILSEFDLSCCRTYFDGEELRYFDGEVLHHFKDMMCTVDIERVTHRLREYDVTKHGHYMQGLTEKDGGGGTHADIADGVCDQKQRLIRRLLQRLDKYDRRRFTIANAEEYKQELRNCNSIWKPKKTSSLFGQVKKTK